MITFCNLFTYIIFFLQVFVQLEYPVLKENEQNFRADVSIQRKTFIDDIMHAHVNNELDAEYLSEQLQYYEVVAEKAVGGNLKLNVTDDFPVQAEKWTILQAIFFASTICTTIGEKIIFNNLKKYQTFNNFEIFFRLRKHRSRNF